MNDIAAVQRDSGSGDGYIYDLTEQITAYQQNGTVNLGAGTVANPQTNTTLTFDGCGNRTSLNGGGTYAANSVNQYTTFAGAAVTSDANGNLQNYNGWIYTYDAQNRLTNATLPGGKGGGGTTCDFYYDAKNRQIARSINGLVTFSAWDGWEIVEEFLLGNVPAGAYLQGVHGPVKSLLNNVYFYQDSLGSTSHIADSSGTLLEYYKYDLYGRPTFWAPNNSQLSASSYSVKDLFSGERWIPEMSIYDLRNRFYSPDLGRFLQPDPISFKGDASNLYRYCGNDWANRTDPTGLLAGFDQYKLEHKGTEDDRHDGWEVVGVAGTETKPGTAERTAVHLEIQRVVSRPDAVLVDGKPAGASTTFEAKVTQTGAHDVTIQLKIEVKYATDKGAGPNTREHSKNFEHQHSSDIMAKANDMRQRRGDQLGKLSPAGAEKAIREGLNATARNGIAPLEAWRRNTLQISKINRDSTPQGRFNHPEHTPFDPVTGRAYRNDE